MSKIVIVMSNLLQVKHKRHITFFLWFLKKCEHKMRYLVMSDPFKHGLAGGKLLVAKKKDNKLHFK